MPPPANIFLDFLDALGRQSFQWSDLALVGLLVVLEGVLSLDNALVLSLLARRLPRRQRRKALTYGLLGALVFRTVAIFAAAWLLHSRWIKLVGGGYLLYLAAIHLWRNAQNAPAPPTPPADPVPDPPERSNVDATSPQLLRPLLFWQTVAVIEFIDLIFAIDSILAAIALVNAEQADGREATAKLWVVVVGGFLGVVLVRLAAVVFITLLRRFPRLEMSAYLLVAVIGGKLLAEFFCNDAAHPHRLDFHDYGRPAAWVFWGLMAIGFGVGFIPRKTAARL